MDNIVPLFSTPIYQSKIEPITSDELSRVTSLIYDGKYSADKFVLDREDFASLKQKIKSALDRYVYNGLSVAPHIEFYITNSWVVKHEKGDAAQLHRHDNSLLSGVVYIQTDETTGEIVFDIGSPSNIFPPAIRVEYSNLNLFNSPSWAHYPYDNDILIFPSHILHKVEPNTSDKTRYSLSFNVFLRGELGNDMSIVNIK